MVARAGQRHGGSTLLAIPCWLLASASAAASSYQRAQRLQVCLLCKSPRASRAHRLPAGRPTHRAVAAQAQALLAAVGVEQEGHALGVHEAGGEGGVLQLGPQIRAAAQAGVEGAPAAAVHCTDGLGGCWRAGRWLLRALYTGQQPQVQFPRAGPLRRVLLRQRGEGGAAGAQR